MKKQIKNAIAAGLWKVLRRFSEDRRFDETLSRELSPWLARMSRRPEYLRYWQDNGFNLTPETYCGPIPKLADLRDEIWERVSECAEIDFRPESQLALLRRLAGKYRDEYAFPSRPTSDRTQFSLGNGAFESVDAEMLYCFVRDQAPAQMVEIGAGFSTLVTASAIRRNRGEGRDTLLTVIEPHPRDFITDGSIPEIGRLIEDKAELAPDQVFTSLGAGDILFIDSSHVARIGGDVNHLFFKVLPQLENGVLIHVHDIVLPEEYIPQFVLDHHFFWNEQYLLRAFLMHNKTYEVVWAGNYMRVNHSDALQSAFDSFDPDTVVPGSFWMRKCGFCRERVDGRGSTNQHARPLEQRPPVCS